MLVQMLGLHLSLSQRGQVSSLLVYPEIRAGSGPASQAPAPGFSFSKLLLLNLTVSNSCCELLQREGEEGEHFI